MRDLPPHDSDSSGTTRSLLNETFGDDCRTGRVLGSRSPDGWLRQGADRERKIGIDHGALRFQPLVTPGWGRQGIAYGPLAREAGLAFAVAITNGHNTSESSVITDGMARRVWRWARGPGIDPVPQRLRALLRGPRKRGLVRRMFGWLRWTPAFHKWPDMNENLAVGWFGSAAPEDPTTDGCGFVVHAALGDNGELWARHGAACLPALRGLQNVRVYYFVILREQGAVCYASAGPDVAGLPAMPMMRPIAIDPHNRQTRLFAGVHQCLLGQIGFRVDTRVHGIRIDLLPEFAEGGPGQIGDALTGDGPLEGAGSDWRTLRGGIRRTGRGAVSDGQELLAVLRCPEEVGLIHALVDSDATGGWGLVWRLVDEETYWALEIEGDTVRLVRSEGGKRRSLAVDAGRAAPRGGLRSLQVSDAGGEVGCFLDGERLFDGPIEAPSQPGPSNAGIWLAASAAAVAVRDFECHPRAVPVPADLRFPAPWRRFGSTVVLSDRFAGGEGEVTGRAPETGTGRWERAVGTGALIADGSGARVRGTVQSPNPGRTFHTLPWSQPDFADVEVEIQPPGTGRGEKEHCRSGLVLWQDEDNYLTVSAWLADEYEGASISFFTKRHGFEELYDAIWTMVGDKVTWGRPFRLRLTCDGDRFVVFLGGEAILERSLSDLYPDDPPLQIRAVGLGTNWEWGDDTGSVFKEFVARL